MDSKRESDAIVTLRERIGFHARQWGVDVENILESDRTAVALGTRADLSVVLKVARWEGDEWSAGDVLTAFGGHGVVRVYECAPGAVLLERLRPGTPLNTLASSGRDAEATEILAGLIKRMSPEKVRTSPTALGWGEAFTRYVASGDRSISGPLVADARSVYEELCASQSATRLLHGDLHHGNVLFDDARGWLAIDPKGVIGELEYELGAALRNPVELRSLFTDRATIEQRVAIFATAFHVDPERVIGWAYAQAVLATIWHVEDGTPVDSAHPFLVLAETMRSMLVRRMG